MHKYVRNRTTDDINSLLEGLSSEMWENVISTTNVNTAYDIFLGVFFLNMTTLPCQKINTKHVNCEKPWFTTGLKNTCHKNNKLYRRFLKNRSNETENCYKKYKK